MKNRLLSVLCLGLIVSCKTPGVTSTSPCIKLPPTATESQKELATKLNATMTGSVTGASLEATYKNNVKIAFASINQRTLDQLVLIEFLVCLQKHHPELLTEDLKSALRIAIAKSVGALNLSEKLSDSTKEAVLRSTEGSRKLEGINALQL